MLELKRVFAAGGAALSLSSAACGPAHPTIESAEFVCDGSTPNLSIKVSGIDRSTEGGLVSTSIADPDNRTIYVDLLRSIPSREIRLNGFDYGPTRLAFQTGEYAVMVVARVGTPSGAPVTRTIFDQKSATLTEDQCRQS